MDTRLVLMGLRGVLCPCVTPRVRTSARTDEVLWLGLWLTLWQRLWHGLWPAWDARLNRTPVCVLSLRTRTAFGRGVLRTLWGLRGTVGIVGGCVRSLA